MRTGPPLLAVVRRVCGPVFSIELFQSRPAVSLKRIEPIVFDYAISFCYEWSRNYEGKVVVPNMRPLISLE